MSCPIETIRVMRHDNPYNGEPCEECQGRIGDTYIGPFGDPYDLPMHGHCKCFWFHDSLTGLWDLDREDLQNQRNENSQQASTTLNQIRQYISIANRLKAQIDQAWDAASYYYDLADDYYSTAEEYYEIALAFYDLAWEYYSSGDDDWGEYCYYYGWYYENIAYDYESAGDYYWSLGEHYENLASDYESRYIDVVDWIEDLYMACQDNLDENQEIDNCLQYPSLDQLIEMIQGPGQIIDMT